MNLYRISQTINTGYDTYDSAVVCAENEEEAIKIYPDADDKYYPHKLGKKNWLEKNSNGLWEIDRTASSSWVRVDQLNEIKVEFIGKADGNINRKVICSSFNAG